MSKVSIANGNSWARFEQSVLEIFTIALEMLHAEASLPVLEDDQTGDSLNRRLSILIHHAMQKWEEMNDDEIATYPTHNAPQRPDLDLEKAQVVNEFEQKKPDFQWGWRDPVVKGTSRNGAFKIYHIECKRLGRELNSTRLNREYVGKGIKRFTSKTHCYGQHTYSGAMIGYVQNTDLQILLDEVNRHATTASLPQIVLTPGVWQPIVSRLEHQLSRPAVLPTPFDLRHLWIDLRHHYSTANATGTDSESTGTPKSRRRSKPKSCENKRSKLQQQDG